jgi:WXG100 family type VII secretion target
MTSYVVNIPVVQEIAGEMGTLSTYIQNLLDDLESSTAQSLAQWNSAARDAYNAAKQIWDQAAADMVAQAANAQRSLASIGDGYSQAERQGSAMWGGGA